MAKQDALQKIKEEALKHLRNNKDLLIPDKESVVASVIEAKSGKYYAGISIRWWHSTCAEMVALGSALLNGEREFVRVIAIKYNYRNLKEEVISACGICREMFSHEKINLKIVIEENGKLVEKSLDEMLPFSKC